MNWYFKISTRKYNFNWNTNMSDEKVENPLVTWPQSSSKPVYYRSCCLVLWTKIDRRIGYVLRSLLSKVCKKKNSTRNTWMEWSKVTPTHACKHTHSSFAKKKKSKRKCPKWPIEICLHDSDFPWLENAFPLSRFSSPTGYPTALEVNLIFIINSIS